MKPKSEKSNFRETKIIKKRFLAPLLGPRVDFWSILGTRLYPAGVPNRLQDVTGTLQILSKSSPRLKNHADRLPGGSQEAPGRSPDTARDLTGTILSISSWFLKALFEQKVIVTLTLLSLLLMDWQSKSQDSCVLCKTLIGATKEHLTGS